MFHRETAISARIQASADKIMALLTQVDTYTQWNSTIVSIKGLIKLGEKVELISTLDPKRTFKLTVRELTPTTLVWESGLALIFGGKRTFSLSPQPDGSTDFLMKEVFTGLMLPLIQGSLPDFTENFKQYATDLKKAAE